MRHIDAILMSTTADAPLTRYFILRAQRERLKKIRVCIIAVLSTQCLVHITSKHSIIIMQCDRCLLVQQAADISPFLSLLNDPGT